MQLTNNTNISLPMAVWLATDDYDHNDDPNTISATTLIKPTRQIILGSRVEAEVDEDIAVDVSSRIASGLGTAIHNSIENAWLTNCKNAMTDLGYPKKVIERVKVNPTIEDFKKVPNLIPIYLEKRAHRKVGNFTVSGKFDFVGQGKLTDFKSSGTYAFQTGSNDWKFKMQGSIYRWLNENIITEDVMNIEFIFTDWSAMRARSESKSGYPQSRLITYPVELMSVDETDIWVNEKLDELVDCWDKKEAELPRCSDKDLWRTKPVWKYYKSGKVTARSTKNFNTEHEALNRLTDDGSVGIVVEIKGQVKACEYCNAFPICTQKDEYINDGSLVM